jgi:hypothetical protein
MMFLVWAMGTIFLNFFPNFFEPSITSQLIIYSYILTFSITSIIFSYIIKGKIGFKKYTFSVDEKMLKVLSISLFLGLIFFISRYINLIMSYDTLVEYFFRVRYASIHLNEPLIETSSLVTQIKTFSMILSVILLYEHYHNKTSKCSNFFLISFITLVLIANVIEGSRNEFVFLSIIYLSIFVLHNRMRNVLIMVSIFFISFFVLSLLTRGSSLEGNLLFNYIKHLATYSFGTMISFDSFLSQNISVSSSIVIKFNDFLLSISDLLYSLPNSDIITQSPAKFSKISSVDRINVYSFLSVRIHYLGFFGAFLSVVLHSFLITYTYKKSHRPLFMFIYLFMLPTTLLSLFHEYFFAMIPYYYRVILIVFLLYKVNLTSFCKNFIPASQRFHTIKT